MIFWVCHSLVFGPVMEDHLRSTVIIVITPVKQSEDKNMFYFIGDPRFLASLDSHKNSSY